MADLLRSVKSLAEFDEVVASGKAVAFFWTSWSAPCKHMATVLGTLAQQNSNINFFKVEAEEVDDVTEKFSVMTVPYFVLLQDTKVVDRLEGADAAALTAKVAQLAATPPTTAITTPPPPPAAAAPVDVASRIKQLLSTEPVVLFMKGSTANPYCGFSRKVVEALQQAGCGRFKDVDILKDEELRQGVKEYSNWPTYPQLYVAGELIGGCDIVMEMQQGGELKQLLQEKVPAALHEISKQQQQPVPAAASSAQPGPLTPEQQQQLAALASQQPVMVFMKGSPEAPRCGFSRKVVEALSSDGIAFGSFDILSDDFVRQGLKAYSQWPTYPQVYVQGELLGGCDIVLEMKQAGELKGNVEEMLHRMQNAD